MQNHFLIFGFGHISGKERKKKEKYTKCHGRMPAEGGPQPPVRHRGLVMRRREKNLRKATSPI